jgi:hypothetical protein
MRSDFQLSKSELLYVELFFKLWLLEFVESVKLISSSDILRRNEGGRVTMHAHTHTCVCMHACVFKTN